MGVDSISSLSSAYALPRNTSAFTFLGLTVSARKKSVMALFYRSSRGRPIRAAPASHPFLFPVFQETPSAGQRRIDVRQGLHLVVHSPKAAESGNNIRLCFWMLFLRIRQNIWRHRHIFFLDGINAVANVLVVRCVPPPVRSGPVAGIWVFSSWWLCF